MDSSSSLDRTFSEVSAFGSEAWVATRFGRSTDWLRKTRRKLEAEGFPSPDPMIGLTLKADVDAWLSRRRRISEQTSEHRRLSNTCEIDISKL